ncbi:MAG: hypothetical protein OJJ54_03620 [Pseudonocardia sp.]|nr:hypothetical protein [Pseudonocardia sp.]
MTTLVIGAPSTPTLTGVRPPKLRRFRWWQGLIAVTLCTAFVAAHGALYGRWIVDDAAITFAYARSLASGAGPVLQPGAPIVEGFTSPAWLALLAAGRALGLVDHGTWVGVPDHVVFPKLLAMLCCAVAFACLYAAARSVARFPATVTVVAGAATAAVPSFVVWVVSGLENSLLVAVVCAIAAVLTRAAVAERLCAPGPAVVVGLLAALAALTRPDGLTYAGAYPLLVVLLTGRADRLRGVRAVVLNLIAFAIPAGAYLAWRIRTFGEYLPPIVLARAQGVPRLDALGRPGDLVAAVGWLPVVLGAVCVGAVMTRSTPFRRGLLAAVLPLALALTAFAVLEDDSMAQFRFATPVWILGAFVVTVAVSRILWLAGLPGRAAAAGLLVLVVGASGPHLLDQARAFRAAPTVPLCLVAATGAAFEGYADVLGVRSGSLLAPDIGGVALTTRLQVVDLAGRTEPRIARFWRTQDMAGLRDHVFDDVRPTFLTSHPVWSAETGIAEDPRLARDYVLLTAIGPDGDEGHWVRRDAVGSADDLAAAQRFAAAVVQPEDREARLAPRGSCGETLRA